MNQPTSTNLKLDPKVRRRLAEFAERTHRTLTASANMLLTEALATDVEGLRRGLESARRRADDAEAAVSRVRQLHVRVPLSAGAYCDECTDADALVYHPCPTLDALDAVDEFDSNVKPDAAMSKRKIPAHYAAQMRLYMENDAQEKP